jgi:hypothetical protein
MSCRLSLCISVLAFVIVAPGRGAAKKYNEFELRDLREQRAQRKEDKARRLEDDQEEQQEARVREKLDLLHHHGDDDLNDDDLDDTLDYDSGDDGDAWRREPIPESGDEGMDTELDIETDSDISTEPDLQPEGGK